MSIPLVVNGAVFNYPQNFDEEWGVDATGWAVAVTAGMLSLSGGNFPLTAPINFGTSFGVNVKSITSTTANPATAGYLLLSKTDTISFRNNANTGNLVLGIDGSNNLTFNGIALGTTALTNTHIYVGNALNVPTDVAMSGAATISNTGAVTLATVPLTGLAALNLNIVPITNGSGIIVSSTTTATQLGYLDATSSIQGQINATAAVANAALPEAGGTMSGAISMASNKITSLSNGTSAGDAVAFNQLHYFQVLNFITNNQLITTSTSYVDTPLTKTITVTNANRVKITATFNSEDDGNRLYYSISQNGTDLAPTTAGFGAIQLGSGNKGMVSLAHLSNPVGPSTVTYTVIIRSAGGTVIFNPLQVACEIILEEIV